MLNQSELNLTPSPFSAARRQVIQAGGLIASSLAAPAIWAAKAPIKVGVMLPASGTYAPLGQAIRRGLELALMGSGNKWGGRPVDWVFVDDESKPAQAAEKAARLLTRDRVDLLIGSVHSGVALAMAKLARDRNKVLLVPNAGANALTRESCAPQIFRTSFSNWQTIVPIGKLMRDRGIKRAAFLTWKYTAGLEYSEGFREGFERHGGEVVLDLSLPFPSLEFTPLLTQIAAAQPDAVCCFFSGSGAAKFLIDYAQAGLKAKIPLYVTGHVTEGILHTLPGAEAQGVVSVLHYADGLPHAEDKQFRSAFETTFGQPPDVFAVQGYDTGLVLSKALSTTQGDTQTDGLMKAMEGLEIASPRGRWKMSKAHNPIQDIYIREVQGQRNVFKGIAAKALADPATGCSLA